MFEYTTTYYDVEYLIENKTAPLSGHTLPANPIPESFYQSPYYLSEVQQMSNTGWEMVTVQPLLRAVYHEGISVGYSLTAGYFIFWKRAKI